MKRYLLILFCSTFSFAANQPANGPVIQPVNPNAGTITGVVAGTGLTGGGTSGVVTLNATGGGGTITGVTAGTGLTGGGTSGTVALNVNPVLSVSTMSIIANSATPASLTNVPLQVTGSVNSNMDAVIQNTNSGTNAKSNFKILGDNGTSSLTASMRSSQYNQANFTVTPSTWGMIATNDHGLAIGAGINGTDSGANLVFFTSAPVSANAWWTMTPSGAVTQTSSFTVTNGMTIQPTNAALAPLSVSTPSATSPALYVSTNAWEGIGTNNPYGPLDIVSGANRATFITDPGNTTYMGLYMDISPVGLTNNYTLVSNGNSTILNAPVASGTLTFSAGGATKMQIFGANGNVGINTTNPATKLHISSGVETIDGTSAGLVITSSSTTQALLNVSTQTATSPALYVSTNNWVGMGNSNPLGPLDLISAGGNRTIFTTVANTFEAMYMNTTTGNTNYLIASNGSSVDLNSVGGGSVNLQIGAQVKLGIIANGNVGIGTIAPVAKLEVSTGALKIDGSGATIQVLADSTTAFEFQASTTTNNFHVAISSSGHLLINGVAPTLSSCGGSPTITGTDNAFRIVPGSAASGCTATFHSGWGAAPTCTVSQETFSLTNALSYTISSTAVTMTETSLTSALDVVCIGNTAP